MKNKSVAAALAFFFGILGIHRFYLGHWKLGLLYVVFCWTYIPALVGIVEAIYFLSLDKVAFDRDYNKIDRETALSLNGLSPIASQPKVSQPEPEKSWGFPDVEPRPKAKPRSKPKPHPQPTKRVTSASEFVALDIEHATSKKHTICAVGLVVFKNGKPINQFYSLVQPPENEYTWFTTNVHGIQATDTADARPFPEVFQSFRHLLDGRPIVAHNAFSADKACLDQAIAFHGIDFDAETLKWVCTYQMTGRKLTELCDLYGIRLDDHHNAMADAMAVGEFYQLFLDGRVADEHLNNERDRQRSHRAIPRNRNRTYAGTNGKTLSDYLVTDYESIENKDNPFYGKKVCVTGVKESEKVEIARILCEEMGAKVMRSTTKNTQILLCGPVPGPKKLERMELNRLEGKAAFTIPLDVFDFLRSQSAEFDLTEATAD